MTNEEAIALLRNLEDALDSYCELNEEGKTAFRMAIEALSCSENPKNSDCISRQAAIDAMSEAYEKDEIWEDYEKRLNELPSAQPETHKERTETHACDCIERQAVEHLDWFTKLYCRDKSITDDLAFRCEQCEFEMPDDRCLVKVMARKLCPDYKDFGAMGDL